MKRDISLRVSEEQLQAIEEVTEKSHRYENRSQFIRASISRLLEEETEYAGAE